MLRKLLVSFVVVVLMFVGALFYSAGGRVAYNYLDTSAEAVLAASARKQDNNRRMVDMVADDSYLIDHGDSTVFILVGNFAAHHNGAVITADSAVRFSNQSFECYGNVLINQNTTYIYGDKAEYSHDSGKARIYSDLIKVVDGDAVMYTYNCTFDTDAEMGEFFGGCYVLKGESLMESERGYYNTSTHDLIAVDNVEMRDEVYQMIGDSVIFNTETENAQYFRNTNIWNDKDEYLFANRGSYNKARDMHHLTRDAYLLSPEREVWSDSIEYYRTAGHIISRGNIQVDDTTQKIIGFADYGEWWYEPGNALFTRRPSMISYGPQQPDSLFLCADTLWMYTIAVPDPNKVAAEASADDAVAGSDAELGADVTDSLPSEQPIEGADSVSEASKDGVNRQANLGRQRDMMQRDSIDKRMSGARGRDAKMEDRGGKEQTPVAGAEHSEDIVAEHTSAEAVEALEQFVEDDNSTVSGVLMDEGLAEATGASAASESIIPESVVVGSNQPTEEAVLEDGEIGDEEYADVQVAVEGETIAVDSLALAQEGVDTVQLTEKQLRYRAKLERRRLRDTARMEKQRLRDSLKAIKRAERDSIQHIKDSLLNIKLDTIIAKRKAQSARLADEEAARLERIKQKSEERRRRKIDKAKARALKRGKEYTGEDYVLDTLATEEPMSRDTLSQDSLSVDSMQLDTMAEAVIERPFPADSSYKLIKAYHRVKMYRSDSQMVCDSMIMLNTDSIIRLYIDPVMWNETNQIVSDSMAIYTVQQRIDKVHFMGDPMMSSQIDTTYYNQVKGKDMTALFADGSIYRNNVDGNAQTIYYMQEQENSTDVTGLMYIESASISFYLTNGEIDKIAYKQNPEYKLYPMDMIPETQKLRLPDFEWFGDRRPSRNEVIDRVMRDTRRSDNAVQSKPRFRITERIDYDRRRLVENGEWEDRVDELLPEVIEWRNSRSSYQNKE